MRRIAYTAGVIGAILIAYNVAERIDNAAEARIALAESYREGCLPSVGETAIIVSDGRVARCRIYRSASTSPGMSPVLISAAAVEVTP